MGVRLESQRTSRPGTGWTADLEAQRKGWAAKLHWQPPTSSSSSSSSSSSEGTPQLVPDYSVSAQAQWNAEPEITHELAWTSPSGESLQLTLRPHQHDGPRLSAGLELR